MVCREIVGRGPSEECVGVFHVDTCLLPLDICEYVEIGDVAYEFARLQMELAYVGTV